MKKIMILVIMITFSQLNMAQEGICDSCKGEITYSEKGVFNNNSVISISVFNNSCAHNNDYGTPKCYKINVISSNSYDTLQTLNGAIFFNGESPSQSLLNMQDINFDNFPDLIILQNDLGKNRSLFHIYIYDSQKSSFVNIEYYGSIFMEDWKIDSNSKTLFTKYETGFHEYVYNTYKFVNGEYVEVDEKK